MEQEVDEEGGRGRLFKQGRKWLGTISIGAAELGGGIMSKHERRKKEDTRSSPSITSAAEQQHLVEATEQGGRGDRVEE